MPMTNSISFSAKYENSSDSDFHRRPLWINFMINNSAIKIINILFFGLVHDMWCEFLICRPNQHENILIPDEKNSSQVSLSSYFHSALHNLRQWICLWSATWFLCIFVCNNKKNNRRVINKINDHISYCNFKKIHENDKWIGALIIISLIAFYVDYKKVIITSSDDSYWIWVPKVKKKEKI